MLKIFQPRATSKNIIMANPIIAPIVEISSFPELWDSGMSSSITTNIIAPAAKERAKGRIGFAIITRPAPIIPSIGSTIADNCPY